MYIPVEGWFAAFLLTIAVEVPVIAVLLRRQEPELLRVLILVVFANLATHPVVWFVIPQLILPGSVPYLVVAETWAVAAETVFYAMAIPLRSPRRALLVALAANAASFTVGRLVGTVWPDLLS